MTEHRVSPLDWFIDHIMDPIGKLIVIVLLAGVLLPGVLVGRVTFPLWGPFWWWQSRRD